VIEATKITSILDDLGRLIEADDVGSALRLLCSTVADFTPGKEIQVLIGEDAPRAS
jgi:hypothetical protein